VKATRLTGDGMTDKPGTTLSSILTAIVAMASRASGQIVVVLVTLIATRFLTPAAFGMFSLASIGIALVRAILWNGAFEYLLKAADPRASSTECLVANLLVTAAFSLPLVLFAFVADRLFGTIGIGHLILLLLPSNLLAAFGAWQESLVLRTGRLRAYYAITFASEAVSALVAIVLLLEGFGVLGLVAQTYVRNAMVLAAYFAMRCTIWSDGFSIARLAAVMRWSISRYLSVLVDFGMSYGADLFLGAFLSPAAAGLYRASNRIVTAVGDIFAHPVNMIARSVFSQRAAEGRSSDEVWPLIFSAAAVVGWSALGGVVVTAGTIVPLALGPMWAAAAPLAAIIAVARCGLLVQAVTSALLVAYDRQDRLFLIQCVSTAATLAALALVARFGVMPATIAVAIVSILTSAWMTALSLRVFPTSRRLLALEMPIVLVPLAATVAGALVAQTAAHHIAMPGNYSLIVTILGGIGCWTLSLVPLRRRFARAIASLHVAPAA
jgi:O-antigen/teichoic acid export membrane protein